MSAVTEKKTRQIALLLERANHPSTPPEEANACRAKADAMMLSYQIDAALVEQGQAQQDKPVWTTVYVCRLDNEWRNFYEHLFRATMAHIGVEGVAENEHSEEDGFRWRVYQVVGFNADIEMFQLLWSSIQLEFSRRFEPSYDKDLSPAVNAYLMRIGGMERKRIAAVMFPGWTTMNEMKARTRRVTKLIKEGAAELGESAEDVLGRGGASIKTHRLSYANGFVHTLSRRMRMLRAERGADERGLVLVSRKERIKEAMYDRYPYMRPSPASTRAIGEEQAKCEKCAKAKSGYCRDHQWMKPSTARSSGPRLSYTAYDRGSAAANQVDLGPGGRGRLDPTRKRLG